MDDITGGPKSPSVSQTTLLFRITPALPVLSSTLILPLNKGTDLSSVLSCSENIDLIMTDTTESGFGSVDMGNTGPGLLRMHARTQNSTPEETSWDSDMYIVPWRMPNPEAGKKEQVPIMVCSRGARDTTGKTGTYDAFKKRLEDNIDTLLPSATDTSFFTEPIEGENAEEAIIAQRRQFRDEVKRRVEEFRTSFSDSEHFKISYLTSFEVGKKIDEARLLPFNSEPEVSALQKLLVEMYKTPQLSGKRILREDGTELSRSHFRDRLNAAGCSLSKDNVRGMEKIFAKKTGGEGTDC